MRVCPRRLWLLSLAVMVLFALPTTTRSDTIAHWIFDRGTPGGEIAFEPVVDESGNNNRLFGFDANYGPSYSAVGDTPTGTGLSLELDGTEDGYALDLGILSFAPQQWTIEAAFNLDVNSGVRTIIGRDGSQFGPGSENPPRASDFYLSVRDIQSNRLVLDFSAADGQRVTIESSLVPAPNTWFRAAAVSDNLTARLFVNRLDGNGWILEGSAPLTGATASDRALATGAMSNWTVGRGWFNGAFVEQVDGNIDDVRFTDIALSPSRFLVPEPASLELTGQFGIHDPSRINKEDGRYYTYGTGYNTGGSSASIVSRYSDDFTHWQNGPAVFNGIPAWAQAEVPDNPGFMWAPDVFYYNGEYRMYYSVSSFGSQNSVIGLATNATLEFSDPSYAWADQGMVIESEVGYSYNTIDPSIFYDDNTNRMWMTFGSYWNGIFITELNPATGKRITPSSPVFNIARNTGSPADAIEASYLTEHDGYYYLFVDWDTCCQGVDSSYNIRVGRSTSPTGPFVDRDGVAMTSGGGELFVTTEGDFIGPGHFSEFSENGTNYFTYHYYDGAEGGDPKLGIREFAWIFDHWPVLVSDLPSGDYNRDGVVDAADYTVWRDSLGSTEDLRANGDNSGLSAGVVDEADYFVWRNNFGAVYIASSSFGAGGTAPSQTAVPEPGSMVLLLLGTLAVFFRRRVAVS